MLYCSGARTSLSFDSIPIRLERGKRADLLILVGYALDTLIARGEVVAETKVDLARSGIGMAVRAGAVKPDISTVEAFERTLLELSALLEAYQH